MLKKFILVVMDHGDKKFSVEGPMQDDTISLLHAISDGEIPSGTGFTSPNRDAVRIKFPTDRLGNRPPVVQFFTLQTKYRRNRQNFTPNGCALKFELGNGLPWPGRRQPPKL